MSKRKPPRKPAPLAAKAGPAFRRAAKVARKEARMHGSAICYVKNGKIVEERP